MIRHALLEVQWGRQAQERAVITPGTTLRVGRTERADFVVPSDKQLAGIHFVLSWDGETCQLRPPRDDIITLVNGEARTSASLHHGDWIRAGNTDFRYFVEGTLPARDPVIRSAEAQVHIDTALLALRTAKGRLYALLDSARDVRILELLQQSPCRYKSLYEGGSAAALADVAPYLVALDKNDPLMTQLLNEGWGHNWGVFLSAQQHFASLRRHFRRFLIVASEKGERLYFRFYDPRVLSVFLHASNTSERSDVLRDVRLVCCEQADGTPILFTP